MNAQTIFMSIFTGREHKHTKHLLLSMIMLAMNMAPFKGKQICVFEDDVFIDD